MTRRLPPLLLIVALMLAVTTSAWASWATSSSNTRGSSRATALPTASAPSGAATGTTVTVTWSAVAIPGGPSVSGYVVRAYDATTTASRGVGGSCTGTVAALTCNDTGVPAGGWKYTVQPKQGGWLGVESAKSAAVAVIPVDTTAPVPTGMVLVNGGTLGTADKGDRIDLTLSEALSVSSLCSTWSGDASDQSLTGNGEVTVTITNSGTNDALTVASGTCTFHLGSVALGADYVSATSTFGGNGSNKSTISWTVSTRVLSITIGTINTSSNVRTGVAASTPTWTPSTSITDLVGNPMAATGFTATSTSRL